MLEPDTTTAFFPLGLVAWRVVKRLQTRQVFTPKRLEGEPSSKSPSRGTCPLARTSNATRERREVNQCCAVVDPHRTQFPTAR